MTYEDLEEKYNVLIIKFVSTVGLLFLAFVATGAIIYTNANQSGFKQGFEEGELNILTQQEQGKTFVKSIDSVGRAIWTIQEAKENKPKK